MNVSTDLQWALLNRKNKFFHCRNGIRLSSDPFNNSGRCTKRHAGFMQEKAAVVKVNGNTGKLYVAVKDGSSPNKPKGSFKTVEAGLKASATSKVVGTVRADLTDIAFRRAKKLAKAMSNLKKVRAAAKVRSAKRQFKHTAKRASRKQ